MYSKIKKTVFTSQLYVYMLLGSSILISCEDQKEDISSPAETSQNFLKTTQNSTPLTLGAPIENAYSVDNMQKAWNNLHSGNRTEEDIEISTTNLYVRFLPKDSLEVALLLQDTTLELFDHPLLFEIEEVGNWYHDPSIPNHLPTYQYTVVDVDYLFPDLEHEVLADLFMIDELEEGAGGRKVSISAWNELEYEALRITGNLDSEEDSPSGGRIAGWYHPDGQIQLEEFVAGTRVGLTPLREVEIVARRGLKWNKTRLRSDGTFRHNLRFQNSVSFKINYDLREYRVTDGALGFTASTNIAGNHKHLGSVFFSRVDQNNTWVRGTVSNAIFDYKLQALSNGVYWIEPTNITKVLVIFGQGSGLANHLNINDVKIWSLQKTNGAKKDTDDLYSVTMHELAHATHGMKAPLNIIWSLGIYNESWADCIEYYFTLPYYPNVVNAFPDRSRALIEDGDPDSWKYTPFFIDLVDNTNQRSNNGGSVDWADDDVAGYTLRQLFDAVTTRTTLDGVCAHLKNNHNNNTQGNLNRLVQFYNDIERDNK